MNDNSRLHEDNNHGPDRSWQVAGERVFLYLRCLNFPVEQIFEISAAVLKAAQQNALSKGNPVAVSMETLHRLIHSYQPDDSRNFPYRRCVQSPGSADGHSSKNTRLLGSMPDIRRLHMTPEDFGARTAQLPDGSSGKNHGPKSKR